MALHVVVESDAKWNSHVSVRSSSPFKLSHCQIWVRKSSCFYHVDQEMELLETSLETIGRSQTCVACDSL
jgi:hypothetical protein